MNLTPFNNLRPLNLIINPLLIQIKGSSTTKKGTFYYEENF